jgi:hypothetical protein
METVVEIEAVVLNVVLIAAVAHVDHALTEKENHTKLTKTWYVCS